MKTETAELQAVLSKQLDKEQSDWLQKQISDCLSDEDFESALAITSANLRRKIGTERFPDISLQTTAGTIYLSYWELNEAARVVLFSEAISANKITPLACYQTGDDKERAAFLKGLAVIDPNGALLDLAIEAGRTNSILQFSAISMHNPYPAKYYDDHQFTQLVTKALFLDLNIDGVQHLFERGCTELARVSAYYAQELTDAGREIPPSIWLATAKLATDEGVNFLESYLKHEEQSHRFYAALAVSQLDTIPAPLVAAAKTQLNVEQSAKIKALLDVICK